MNKYEKAIRYFEEQCKALEEHCKRGGDFALGALEHTKTAIEAMKKQVPRAGINYKRNSISSDCPNCGHDVICINNSVIHCLHCGQLITRDITYCVNHKCVRCGKNGHKRVCPYYADKVDEIRRIHEEADNDR
ncbi:MAG: hypothetical protein E7485_08320 [Ruminococcaceae bacterium]|nr:hypothetical protein [Oscillospiraceae bacterium]